MKKGKDAEYQLHSVRIREDYWKALAPLLQCDSYHNSFQEFVEKCIIEKAALENNIEIEIRKTEGEIKRLQELNSQRLEIFKSRQAKEAEELEKKLAEDRKKEKLGKKKKKSESSQCTIIICPECKKENLMINKKSVERKCSHCGFVIKKENFDFKQANRGEQT